MHGPYKLHHTECLAPCLAPNCGPKVWLRQILRTARELQRRSEANVLVCGTAFESILWTLTMEHEIVPFRSGVVVRDVLLADRVGPYIRGQLHIGIALKVESRGVGLEPRIELQVRPRIRLIGAADEMLADLRPPLDSPLAEGPPENPDAYG
jgi:hypothetical protein